MDRMQTSKCSERHAERQATCTGSGVVRFLRTTRHPSASLVEPATSFDQLYERGEALDDETLERVRKQLEIRVFDRQARGRRGAGAGHDRYKPNLCLSPRGLGQAY